MRVLLLEDEEPAARRLIKMIREIEPTVEILDTIVSVASAIAWFRENKQPDLLFSDIQLSDGISFSVFKEIKLTCPVIFTTAYDHYAIEAFKVNSIDYLLKPIRKEHLELAMQKHKSLNQQSLDIQKLLDVYGQKQEQYKERFVIRYGDHIKTINIADVAYFFTEDRMNYLQTHEGRPFAIDYNLDNVETMVNPKNFFRINRQFIISISAIHEMFSYSKGRVHVKLKPPSSQQTIVSAERSADFKLWLGGEV